MLISDRIERLKEQKVDIENKISMIDNLLGGEPVEARAILVRTLERLEESILRNKEKLGGVK